MSIIAIIPARGGSKRIERKNCKLFAGKPMIAHAIDNAKKCQIFDHIIVSTDDNEIKTIANHYGALTPFLRPECLSDDHTGTDDVIRHAIDEIKSAFSPKIICALYPCTPLLPSKRLIEGYKSLDDDTIKFSFSVLEYPHPIERALVKTGKGVTMTNPSMANSRTQDIEAKYHDAGQFYFGRLAAWMNNEPIFASYSTPIVLSRSEAVDIDTEDDWAWAESLYAIKARA